MDDQASGFWGSILEQELADTIARTSIAFNNILKRASEQSPLLTLIIIVFTIVITFICWTDSRVRKKRIAMEKKKQSIVIKLKIDNFNKLQD